MRANRHEILKNSITITTSIPANNQSKVASVDTSKSGMAGVSPNHALLRSPKKSLLKRPIEDWKSGLAMNCPPATAEVNG